MWRNILLMVAVLNEGASATNWQASVVSDSGEKLHQVQWQINDVTFESVAGELAQEIKEAAVYHVRIQTDGHYPSYQTFSHEELTWNKQANIVISEITLVEKKPERVLLAFGGDVMMGRRFQKPYFHEPVLIGEEALEQGQTLLKQVKPYFEVADYAAVNLESQVSDKIPSARAPKSVTFISPPETIPALQWAGIDYVTLGNNHIYDHLDEGLISTLKYLNKYGMSYSGAGLNQEQALRAHTWHSGKQGYDWLGFVGWAGGFSPNQVAEAEKGGSAWGSAENIKKTVKQSQQQNNVTIVQYHGSLEYSDEPTGMTESRLKSAVDLGADLVVAHHPHVTQGLELYQGKLIAYSMGNLLFDQYFHSTPLTYVLYVWMDGETFHRAEVVPVYLKGYQPGPATGQVRQRINQRTRLLTAQRGLHLGSSGGHLVAEKSSDSPQAQVQKEQVQKEQVQKGKVKQVIFNKQRTQALWQFPQHKKITQINSKQVGTYRLGKEQFNGGSFDGHYWYESPERSWEIQNGEVSSWPNHTHDLAVKLNVSDNQKAQLSMKTFRRVYQAASDMSYLANIKTDQAIKATLYLQKRGSRDKFLEARNNKLTALGQLELQASESKQQIQMDFNLPRVGYRSYRLLLSIESESPKTHQVWLDDVSLVEWQGHYTPVGEVPYQRSLMTEATHIGIPETENRVFEIHYQ